MLPVEQADDLPVRVGRPPSRNDDITLLEVWMTDAELTGGGAPGDE